MEQALDTRAEIDERAELTNGGDTAGNDGAGFDGILASADDSSFCSSAEGLQTFRTFTFTGGC